MKLVAIIHRRLREGKTYDDYRKAWFHATGFGIPTTMYTVIDAFDPKEIISVAIISGGSAGYEEMKSKLQSMLVTDVKERNASPLDDVVEDTIARHFGLVIAEDDFSPADALQYVAPTVDGKKSNYGEFVRMSSEMAQFIAEAGAKRDKLTAERKKKREAQPTA